MKIEFSQQIFNNFSNMKFHDNPFSGSRFFPVDRQKDRPTDIRKLRVALRNFVNSP